MVYNLFKKSCLMQYMHVSNEKYSGSKSSCSWLNFLAMFAIMLCASFAAVAQDVIVTKDSRRIEAEIIDVSSTVIRYRVYGKPSSPVVTISVKEVQSVIYASEIEAGENDETDDDETPDKKQSRRPSRRYMSGTHAHAYADLHGLYSFKYGFLGVGPKIAVGAQVSDFLFVGGGIAALLYNNRQIFEDSMVVMREPDPASGNTEPEEAVERCYDMIPKYGLTAFVTTKISIPLSTVVSLFVEGELACDVAKRDWLDEWFSGWHYSGGAGISLRRFTLSAGYQSSQLPLDRRIKPYDNWTYYSDGYDNGLLESGCLYVKIGVKIGRLPEK